MSDTGEALYENMFNELDKRNTAIRFLLNGDRTAERDYVNAHANMLGILRRVGELDDLALFVKIEFLIALMDRGKIRQYDNEKSGNDRAIADLDKLDYMLARSLAAPSAYWREQLARTRPGRIRKDGTPSDDMEGIIKSHTARIGNKMNYSGAESASEYDCLDVRYANVKKMGRLLADAKRDALKMSV